MDRMNSLVSLKRAALCVRAAIDLRTEHETMRNLNDGIYQYCSETKARGTRPRPAGSGERSGRRWKQFRDRETAALN